MFLSIFTYSRSVIEQTIYQLVQYIVLFYAMASILPKHGFRIIFLKLQET